MDLQLQDKTALVTGSTAGIGFAIAERLAAEGATVVVNGRTQERVDAAMASITDKLAGAKLRGIAADVSTAAGVKALVAQLPDVDILVNNVGIFGAKPFVEISDEDWQNVFDVNVMSAIRLTRHYLPGMKARNSGRLIYMSSESGTNIPVEMIHYGLSKTALIALAAGVAKDCAQTGITANSILAGPTWSEGVSTFVGELAEDKGITPEEMEQEFFRSARPTSLLQRFIKPAESANIVADTASPLAAATTGAALRAEGGLLITLP